MRSDIRIWFRIRHGDLYVDPILILVPDLKSDEECININGKGLTRNVSNMQVELLNWQMIGMQAMQAL